MPPASARIPRLYAAASLKHYRYAYDNHVYGGIPRLYAAASLKPKCVHGFVIYGIGIPRLYAAASLKPRARDVGARGGE